MSEDVEKELGLVSDMGGAGMRCLSSDDKELSVEYIRQCVRYENGKLFWLRRPPEHFKNAHGMNIWNSQNAGKEAGHIKRHKSDERWRIRINKKSYRRSRLVWALFNAILPVKMIDHINHDSLDDRIENLREATSSQNSANSRIGIGNTSGYKGVHWDKSKRKWLAQTKVNGKHKHIGYFSTPEEAHTAYVDAAKLYFGEFAYAGV